MSTMQMIPPAQSRPYGMSNLELAARVDGLTHQRAAVLANSGDETFLYIIDEHLTPLRTEIDRRVTANQRGELPNPDAPIWRMNSEAIRQVRSRAHILFPLEQVGWTPLRTSRTGKWNGPCPFCGEGHDRFIVWESSAGRDGWAMCNQCGYSNDVIDLSMTLLGWSFPRAVEELALVFDVDITQPDDNALAIVAGNADRVRFGGGR